MRGVNRITLIGRVGRDPELRRPAGDNGTPWCVLSVATEHGERDGEGFTSVTDWHRVKIFGKDAERCQTMLGVGDPVAVEGTLVYEKWTDKEGMRRSSPVIKAERLTFLPSSRRERSSAPAPALAEATLEV